MTTPAVATTPRSASLTTIVILCFAYGMLALLLMHLLRPDYGPVDHMVSDYAVGRSVGS